MQCQEPFTISRPGGTKFCSLPCRQEWYVKNGYVKKDRSQKYCPTCSTPLKIDAPPRQVYCSKECSQKAISNNKLVDEVKIKNCQLCNAPFEVTHHNMKFCTSDCRLAYNLIETKKRNQLMGSQSFKKSSKITFNKSQSQKILSVKEPEKNQNDNKDSSLVICKGCNFPFLATNSRQTYCSETCHKVSIIKERKLKKMQKKAGSKYV
jgi:hypothetical protein